MLSFTETAACEWAPAGVRVNAVAPGYIASSGLDRYGPEVAEHIRKVHEGVPLYRLGTESEVSAAVCFLLCEAAAFITGTTLRIDGGRPNARLAWPPIAPERSARYDGFHRASVPAVLKDKKTAG
jgi:citronellol/citronellal dehydrogenase